MLNIYLLIELLTGTDAAAAAQRIRTLGLGPCQVVNAVELNPRKLAAQIDCPDIQDVNAAILQKITRVEGVVQTNIVATVHPRQ